MGTQLHLLFYSLLNSEAFLCKWGAGVMTAFPSLAFVPGWKFNGRECPGTRSGEVCVWVCEEGEGRVSCWCQKHSPRKLEIGVFPPGIGDSGFCQ